MEQLEFANVIILNKLDLVTENDAKLAEAVIRRINRSAKILMCSYSNIDIRSIISTGLFSMEEASNAAGWLMDLKGDVPHTPETMEYGISSFVYKSRNPFHPTRLLDWIRRYFVIEDEKSLYSLEELSRQGAERKETMGKEVGWILRYLCVMFYFQVSSR